MIARGVLDVFGSDFKALSYIAGTGHITLTVGLQIKNKSASTEDTVSLP